LLVFLASSFGSLLRAIQRRREEAEQRSAELGALLAITEAASASLDADRLAVNAADKIRAAAGFRAVTLVRHHEGKESVVLASSGDPACGPSPDTTEGHPAGCHLVRADVGTEADGLTVTACRTEPILSGENVQQLVDAAGEQVWIGLENARLYRTLETSQAEQRRLMGRLVSAHEDERSRIVGEVHDGLGQDLHRVLFGVRGCRASPPEGIGEELAGLEKLVEQSSKRLRRLLQDLRPSTLEDVGLTASVRSLIGRIHEESDLRVELVGTIIPEPPVPVRVAVFRIVQEALRNVAKHSRTNWAQVDLSRDDDQLVVRITDRGPGELSPLSEGLGLWLMKERAEAVGGSLTFDSGPKGTTVTVRTPVDPTA
jgi:signal transduction histidine kinase